MLILNCIFVTDRSGMFVLIIIVVRDVFISIYSFYGFRFN